jgi:hypothetical protein
MSSSFSGIFVLLFIVALSDFIKLLPVSTLTGVLFMVVLSTFQWKTFVILRYGRLSDSVAILLVTLIAVFFNLAIAIGIGIVFSALVHAWDSGAHVDADITIKENMMVTDPQSGEETTVVVKYVHVKGAIFFSSTRKFVNLFDVAHDPPWIILDFQDALIVDHSAVAAIQGICHRFEQAGKHVVLQNVATKSQGRLHRTGDHKALRRNKEWAATHNEMVDLETADGGGDGSASNGLDEMMLLRKQDNGLVVALPSGGAAPVQAGSTDEQHGSATEEEEEEQHDPSIPHPPQPVLILHPHHVDEYQVGDTLSHLPMFHGPVTTDDDLEEEVEILLQHQGVVDIHEKDE